jgi:hypothetical protein
LQHPHVIGELYRKVQQDGLAHSGVTGEHERAASPRTGIRQEALDPGTLIDSPDHERILRGK